MNPTKRIIRQYARHLAMRDAWQESANELRDQLAKLIEREGNWANGSRATAYRVKKHRVKTHWRSGYSAMRVTV